MSALTAWDLVLFTVTVGLAAAAQSLTGFGFTLLGLGMLGFWMDLRDATLALAPTGFVLNIFLAFRLRKHFALDGLRPLLVAGLVGVPLGAALLFRVNPKLLELVLGAIMLLQAVQGLFVAPTAVAVRPWHPVAAGIPCGFASGVLTGAFGVGGPPTVSFLLNRPLNRFQLIASMQVLFGLFSGARLIQFFLLGRLEPRHLHLLLPGVVAAAAGASVGLYLLRLLSDRTARLVVLWFVLVCGLRYLWVACL